ncbi:MAG: hypothetical protein KJO84_04530, partial [Acidimicrobiia bacterium]|nr:hypothetical protein [Acidimicrobiia bacterium]
MVRRITVVLTLVVGLLALSLPALAADEVEVAQALAERGYYLESGVDIDGDEASELVAAARREGSAFHMAVLSDDPDGGATFFAERVYQLLENSNLVTGGVVVVFTPFEVGYFAADDVFDSSDLDT